MARCRDPRRSQRRPGQRARRAALVALVGCLLAAPRVHGDEAAAGRRHAQRASHLAAGGKCRQAIAEFDKAIAVLHDPTLLFNRGECHRRLGDSDSALEDYNQFLSDLPNAPNRAEVEARIAGLRRKAPARPPLAPMGEPAATTVDARAGAGAAVAPGVAGPRKATEGAVSPPLVGTVGEPGPSSRLVAPPSPAPAVDQPEGVALASPGGGTLPAVAESSSRRDSLASRPWFWVALAAVVVGTGVGAYFALGRDPTTIPRSDLGNYRF